MKSYWTTVWSNKKMEGGIEINKASDVRKEIERRKRWFMFMANQLPMNCEANAIEELLNLAFITKPIKDIEENLKELKKEIK